MRKAIFIIVAVLMLSLSTAVFADDGIQTPILLDEASTQNEQKPVLKDVQTISDEETRQIIKIYDVPISLDLSSLGEKSFEKNGYIYEKGDVLKVSDNTKQHTKLASQTMTVSHQTKEAGSLFMPLLDYSMDGYTGQLKLDTSSVFTEPAGKQSYSYTVTDTREFKSLARNDTYYIPKTAEKNGVSLSLSDVKWTAMGDGKYNATAVYSGSATGTKVTGYTSTAVYIGEVTKTEVLGETYKVIYDGKAIPPLAPRMMPWLMLCIGGILLIVCCSLLFKYRLNTKVYALLNGRYVIVKRARLTYLNPIVSLKESTLKVQSEEYIIAIDRFAVRELHGQFVQIFLENGSTIHRRVLNEGNGIKLQISALPQNDDSDMEEESI